MPRDVIVLKRPASREKDMWKEALGLGGKISKQLWCLIDKKEQKNGFAWENFYK